VAPPQSWGACLIGEPFPPLLFPPSLFLLTKGSGESPPFAFGGFPPNLWFGGQQKENLFMPTLTLRHF